MSKDFHQASSPLPVYWCVDRMSCDFCIRTDSTVLCAPNMLHTYMHAFTHTHTLCQGTTQTNTPLNAHNACQLSGWFHSCCKQSEIKETFHTFPKSSQSQVKTILIIQLKSSKSSPIKSRQVKANLTESNHVPYKSRQLRSQINPTTFRKSSIWLEKRANYTIIATTVAFQQEGSGFKPGGQLGSVCVVCARSCLWFPPTAQRYADWVADYLLNCP